MLVYFLAYFNFELEDEALKTGAYPLMHLGQSKKIPINVRITKRV